MQLARDLHGILPIWMGTVSVTVQKPFAIVWIRTIMEFAIIAARPAQAAVEKHLPTPMGVARLLCVIAQAGERASKRDDADNRGRAPCGANKR